MQIDFRIQLVPTYPLTVTATSSETCLVKTPNKHGRIWSVAEPVPPKLLALITRDMRGSDVVTFIQKWFVWVFLCSVQVRAPGHGHDAVTEVVSLSVCFLFLCLEFCQLTFSSLVTLFSDESFAMECRLRDISPLVISKYGNILLLRKYALAELRKNEKVLTALIAGFFFACESSFLCDEAIRGVMYEHGHCTQTRRGTLALYKLVNCSNLH